MIKSAYIHFENESSSKNVRSWKAKYITVDKVHGPYFYFENHEKDLQNHHPDVTKQISNKCKNYTNVNVNYPALEFYCDESKSKFKFNNRILQTPHSWLTAKGKY